MSDKIRQSIMNSYLCMVNDFSNPNSLSKSVVEEKIGSPISKVFDSQRASDHAKTVYGKKGIKVVYSLYFNNFVKDHSLNYKALDHQLKKNHKIMTRHLGPDKIKFLEIIVMLFKDLDGQKGGLLYMVDPA